MASLMGLKLVHVELVTLCLLLTAARKSFARPDASIAAASSNASASATHEHHRPHIVVTSGDQHANVASPLPNGASTPVPEVPEAAGDATIAQVIDKALEKEFAQDTKDAESEKGKTFNATVASEEGTVETVVRISGSGSTAEAPAAATNSSAGSVSGSSSADASGAGNEAPVAPELPQIELGVDRIIDSEDNEFVLSAPKDSVATLTLDPLLIQDLTFLFASAAVMGMVFESIKQPVINGYLVAGAIVGPGGLQLIKELVQVESLAQLGVQLLLFHLGRELSFKKLKAVWSVALLGGSLQILALMALGGLVAAAVKSNVTQGIFVGALLSMSSTSVVVKCLETYKMTSSAFGQITIGTLILQDCSVGLMFALMPAFGAAAASGNTASAASVDAARLVADGGEAVAVANSIRDAALLGAAALVVKVVAKLVLVLIAASAVAKTILPLLLRLLLRHASKELVQLSLMSLCLISAWCCGQLGISEELGAFIAGAMMSVAERKLVAAGLLLPNHGSSAPSTPRDGTRRSSEGHSPTSSDLAVAYYTNNAIGASDSSPTRSALKRAVAGPKECDPLVSTTGAYSEETLPLHATLQPSPSHCKHGVHVAVSEAGSGCAEPAISVCANIESIQNVLTSLFVASMGLIMSPVFLLHHAAVLLLGTVVVTLVKAAVVTLVIRLFGVPLRLGLAVGLSMAHLGEFSLILLSLANQLKLLSTQVYMLLLGVTAMSLLTTPFVIMGAVHLLIREGHHQLYISGPRLRLSSAAGESKPNRQQSADWAVVMDGQAMCSGQSAVPRGHGGKESRTSTAENGNGTSKRHTPRSV